MRSFTLIVVLGAVVACGKIPASGDRDDGGMTPQIDAMTDPCLDPAPTLDTLGVCLIDYFCAYAVRCEGVFANVDDCKAHQDDFDVNTFLQRSQDAVNAGRQTYHPDVAASCLAEIRGLANGTSCDGLEPVSCNEMFTGDVNDGGTCFVEEDCQTTGAQCTQTLGSDCQSQCCAGSCTAPLPLGSDCHANPNCQPGAVCAYEGNVGGAPQYRCRSGDLTTNCFDNSGCERQLFCAANKCIADNGPGGVCTDGNACADPLACVNGFCADVSTVGATCTGQCGKNLYCETPGGVGTGTCKKVPDMAGANCVQPGYCKGNLVCDTVCKVRPGPGESCKPYECATGSFCSAEIGGATGTGTCQQVQDNGRGCTSDGQCKSGICADDGVTGSRVCQAYMVCQ